MDKVLMSFSRDSFLGTDGGQEHAKQPQPQADRRLFLICSFTFSRKSMNSLQSGSQSLWSSPCRIFSAWSWRRARSLSGNVSLSLPHIHSYTYTLSVEIHRPACAVVNTSTSPLPALAPLSPPLTRFELRTHTRPPLSIDLSIGTLGYTDDEFAERNLEQPALVLWSCFPLPPVYLFLAPTLFVFLRCCVLTDPLDFPVFLHL